MPGRAVAGAAVGLVVVVDERRDVGVDPQDDVAAVAAVARRPGRRAA